MKRSFIAVAPLLFSVIHLSPMAWWPFRDWSQPIEEQPQAQQVVQHDFSQGDRLLESERRFFEEFFTQLMLAEPLNATLDKLKGRYPLDCARLSGKSQFKHEDEYKSALLRFYKHQLKPLFSHYKIPLGKVQRPLKTALLPGEIIGLAEPNRLSRVCGFSQLDPYERDVWRGLESEHNVRLPQHSCSCFDPSNGNFFFFVNCVGIYQCAQGKVYKSFYQASIKDSIVQMIATTIDNYSLLICLLDGKKEHSFFVIVDTGTEKIHSGYYPLPGNAAIKSMSIHQVNNKACLLFHSEKNDCYLLQEDLLQSFLNCSEVSFRQVAALSASLYALAPNGAMMSASSAGKISWFDALKPSRIFNNKILTSEGELLENPRKLIPLYNGSCFILGTDDVGADFCILGEHQDCLSVLDLFLYNNKHSYPLASISNNVLSESIAYTHDYSTISFVSYDINQDSYTLHIWDKCQYFASLTVQQLILLIALDFYITIAPPYHVTLYSPKWNSCIMQGYHNIDPYWEEVFDSLPPYWQSVYKWHKEFKCDECRQRLIRQHSAPYVFGAVSITDSYCWPSKS